MRLITLIFVLFAGLAQSQNILNNPGSNHGNKFEQLGTILPSPNEYRTASGAPGNKYWQQQVDYNIKCSLDENNLKLTGSEVITYHNNSPDNLPYLWFQLDENQHSTVNNANYQDGAEEMPKRLNDRGLESMKPKKEDNGYGVKINKLVDAKGMPLKYIVNKTMMKVELPKPLKPGEKYTMTIDWSYKIVDRMNFYDFSDARGGYEYFKEDGNHIFTMAQWYPRLCMYNDVLGWQNHQFTGRGEFTVCFGDFHVEMTVPADHMVGATGECKNYDKVLTPIQKSRWKMAQVSSQPVQMNTLDEVLEIMKSKSKSTKTWIYDAKNVRDFAWTASRRFVWDAMPVNIEGKKVMAMSFYAKEAYPIYSKYSTKAVAHTIKTYSDFSIPYPYPVAQSVEAANGMEYPMICFNPGRALPDGTYAEGAKNAAILVIIHEVGHTFFPMIVNSDERQWSWMDEGLNSYLQYLTQELWDDKYPSDAGPAYTITEYMKGDKNNLEPIMTNSENIVNFGSNAYDKVATGLNILRETVVGRKLFDEAFREYSRRWAFKHPTPADFFRTIEDATGEDLDWFWRGWFYSTDYCDMAIDTVKHAMPNVNAIPKIARDTVKMIPVPKPNVNSFEDISKVRNKEDKNIAFETDRDTTLRDFYWQYDRGIQKYDTTKQVVPVVAMNEPLDEEGKKKYEDKHLYEITFSNKGGLVMPIIVEFTFKDGTKEVEYIPAQVWRKNESKMVKTFYKEKEVASITLDPMKETADVDESNNLWNKEMPASRFELYKQKKDAKPAQGINPMQVAKKKGRV
jgi:Peptidase family M1 domain